MNSVPLVSIILVNYNTKDYTLKCIDSIYKQTKDISFEIIVSDNDSSDGSIDAIKQTYPEVILIDNKKNLGFGAANNKGLEVAKGKYIFYLNSDTILLNNAVKIFFDYFETNKNKENLGAIGSNLLNEDKTIGDSWGFFIKPKETINELIHAIYGLNKLFLKNKLLKKEIHYTKGHKRIEHKLGQVDTIIGADLFLPNNTFAKFDERYFLYHEEMDLQFQMKKNALNRILIDGPEIIHFGGKSSISNKNVNFDEITSFSSVYKQISRVIFISKNYSKTYGFFVKILTLLLWQNPLIINKTKKYFKQLLKA